ncbi:zinc finger protein SNAI1-like [Penaeus indicus]|uniref:zinc finger protein SNAI1-like n=1 Tax=Penaeus indicus TaxID=29960 RepID=UPI00300DB66C
MPGAPPPPLPVEGALAQSWPISTGLDSTFQYNIPLSFIKGVEALRVLVCPVCGRRFEGKNQAKRSKLESHLRTHTGERPFHCPHCPYRATFKWNLKAHVRSRHERDFLQSAPP